MDWLRDFVEFSSYGESSPKIMYWTGVGTIAGALRRKVWIDQIYFQWTPNFYILVVGPPGSVKKSTSIEMGLRLLRQVEGIDFGPQIVTWQQLISHMANSRQSFPMKEGPPYECSSVTISLSEFGSFFDPSSRELVDNLTDIWDAKLGHIRKETRTMGDDEIINPWLNIMACTTPGWIADNFTEKLIKSGFASRPIYIHETRPAKDVPYPRRNMPPMNVRNHEGALVEQLRSIAELVGEFHMTDAAYVWGEKWYMAYRHWMRSLGSQTEAGFYERKQTHLHKLAMVIAASQGSAPVVDKCHLEEAEFRLNELDKDVRHIFGFVGQTRMSSAAAEILEIFERTGRNPIRRSELFGRYFLRRMTSDEFDVALKSVQRAGHVRIEGQLDGDFLVVPA